MSAEPKDGQSSVAPELVTGDSSDIFDSAVIDTRALIEELPIGIFVIDVRDDGRFTCAMANKVFADFVNRPSVTGAGELWNTGDLAVHLQDCVSSRSPVVFEWVQDKDVDQVCFEFRTIPQIDNTGRVRRILGTATDRTKQRRAEKQMLHQAMHDTLTSLPNRTFFDEAVEQAEKRAAANHAFRYSVLVLNVDRLQSINDSLGHLTGDELLVALARRLQHCVRTQDLMARISGDEFAVLIAGYRDFAEVRQIVDRIHATLEKPFKLSAAEVFTSVGIGIASNTEADSPDEDVIRNADLAMHRAKTAGRGQSEVFREDLHRQTRSRLHLEADMRKALEEAQFFLDYQPIVHLDSGELHGVEALVRWAHPRHGVLSPKQFIALAEETGMIIPLGRWTMNEACRQLAEWRQRFLKTAPKEVSVNVSSIQLMREEFVNEVTEAIHQHDISPTEIKIEVTETTLMDNPSRAVEALTALKRHSIPLAIDDFGTGHSSLGYLQRFPFDVLKIDRTFVAQMMEDEGSRKIVHVIVSLADALDLDVVAEGIETAAQWQRLKDLGCQYGQGYFFAKPCSVEMLEANFGRQSLVAAASD